MGDTRTKLLDGTVEVLRTKGLAGVSARSVATAAGANQALVFYHFDSVDNLLAEACQRAAAQRVERFRAGFARVASLPDLLKLGRSIHEQERRAGNVDVLAQLLAAGQADSLAAKAAAAGLALWVDEVEAVLRRVLDPTPVADFIEPRALAKAVSAAFIGIELYEGVDSEGADAAFTALEQLGALAAILEDAGPLTRAALRHKLRRPG